MCYNEAKTERNRCPGCILKPRRRRLDAAGCEETYSGEFCLKILQFPYRGFRSYSIMASEQGRLKPQIREEVCGSCKRAGAHSVITVREFKIWQNSTLKYEVPMSTT